MPEAFVSELKRIFLSKGFDRGLEYFERHRETIQSSSEIGVQVVNTLLEFTRFEQATHLLDILVKKYETFPEWHLTKGKLLRLQYHFEEAEKEYALEVDCFSKTPSWILEVLSLYYWWGRIDKCWDYYPEFDALLPDSMESKVVLTYILIAIEDIKGAKKVLKSAEGLKSVLWDFNYQFKWLKEYVDHHAMHPEPSPIDGKISNFSNIWYFVDSIFKYLKKEEAEVLFNFARDGAGNGAIVEIGSECGRSSVALGWGSKAKGREKVYSIDLYPLYKKYLNNIQKAGLVDYVIPIVGYSDQIAKTWSGEAIRLLFIDGNHTYPFVLEDFEKWSPFLCSGGIIVFHDTSEGYLDDGPRRVFKEKIMESHHFKDVVQMENMAYAVKL